MNTAAMKTSYTVTMHMTVYERKLLEALIKCDGSSPENYLKKGIAALTNGMLFDQPEIWITNPEKENEA